MSDTMTTSMVFGAKLLEAHKENESLRQQLQQLEERQAPSPCGVDGHLRLHWIKRDDCEEIADSRSPDGKSLTEGSDPFCILCERQAKLLEAAKWAMDWLDDNAVNDAGYARAAAAIAEEGKK